MMHAKAVLVDGRRAYVCSYNVYPRSQKLNSETGVIIESEEIGADMQAFVADLEKGSRLVAHGGKLDTTVWRPRPRLLQRVMWPLLKASMYVPGVWGQL